MENMKPTEKSSGQDAYFIDESFVDEKKHCVHVPVTMPKIKGVLDIDIEDERPLAEIKKKYSKLVFTGRQDTISDEKGINEYLFFFE